MRAVSRSLSNAVLPENAMDQGSSRPCTIVSLCSGEMLTDPADSVGEGGAGGVGAHATRAIPAAHNAADALSPRRVALITVPSPPVRH
ncbi:hypothetical protein GCM10010213_16060 [Microbacterium maritypicum]|nr:hypothetical protein GCM10010213_16060 [Microbacterium liquefaciens]